MALKSTLLIAHEGINNTIAGSQPSIEATLTYLKNIPAIGEFTYRLSYTNEIPFYRTKVKLKKDIITMGITDIDPTTDAGEYVKPEDWNDLISDPDVVLIDTRNDYKYQVGTFTNAVNPNTDSFREFPEYVKENLDKNTHKKIAMFCTWGHEHHIGGEITEEIAKHRTEKARIKQEQNEKANSQSK